MPSLVRHPSSVNISHLDLLENHWAELNHAWQRCSLWGPILHQFCYVLCRFVKKWSSGDIGNISFSIIFFREPLKRWYGNVICMFILRSLTGLVTFWAHRKFKIVASWGQSLLWNHMQSNIFMVYLKNTEQNLTTLGWGIHYYVLRKCCYFSCRFVKK